MSDTTNSGKREIEQLRDEVIKLLEYNYSHGYIDMDLFEKRLEMAINTTLPQDLSDIKSELNTIPPQSDNTADSSINSGTVRSDETFTGILSGVKRKGVWKPARNNRIFAFMGGVDLDFSEAVLAPGETDFEFFCVMSGINIIVPEGINIEVSGIPIIGGIDSRVPDEHYPGRPTLKIHGIAFMAGVDIKPAKKKKRRN